MTKVFKKFYKQHLKTKSCDAIVTPVTKTSTRPSWPGTSQVWDFQTDLISPPSIYIPALTSDPTSTIKAAPLSTPANTQLRPAPSTESSNWSVIEEEVATLKGDISKLKDQLVVLEYRYADLMGTHAKITLELQDADKELTYVRANFFAEVQQHDRTKRRFKAVLKENENLEKKLGQAQRFASLMINIKLDEPIFTRAKDSIDEGEHADKAIVDAIKTAATKPGSAWAKLIDAVNGPRTPEEYLSAINMTLATRRQLRENKKVAKFWKDLARENPENQDVITPSSSNLGSIHEVLSDERQRAVDDLWEKVKRGDPPYTRILRTYQKPVVGIPPAKESEKVEATQCLLSLCESGSGSIPASQGTANRAYLALAPQPTQIFQEEMIASHYNGNLFRNSIHSVKSVLETLKREQENDYSLKVTRSCISVPDQELSDEVACTVEELMGKIHAFLHPETKKQFLHTEVAAPQAAQLKVLPDIFANTLTNSLCNADPRITDESKERAAHVRTSGGSNPFSTLQHAEPAPSTSNGENENLKPAGNSPLNKRCFTYSHSDILRASLPAIVETAEPPPCTTGTNESLHLEQAKHVHLPEAVITNGVPIEILSIAVPPSEATRTAAPIAADLSPCLPASFSYVTECMFADEKKGKATQVAITSQQSHLSIFKAPRQSHVPVLTRATLSDVVMPSIRESALTTPIKSSLSPRPPFLPKAKVESSSPPVTSPLKNKSVHNRKLSQIPCRVVVQSASTTKLGAKVTPAKKENVLARGKRVFKGFHRVLS